MTNILVARLKEKYPPIAGRERISFYGAQEIIFLDLFNPQQFHPGVLFSSHKEIERIARAIFDVPFKYEIRGSSGQGVFF